MKKNKKCISFLVLLSISILLSGCFGVNNNSKTPTTVEVRFGDTPLTLRSMLKLGNIVSMSETGIHSMVLKENTNYNYQIDTLLGSYSGDVFHDGTSPLRLRVPEFEGWSYEVFNNLLAGNLDGRNETQRWEYGRTIKVWIEPNDPKVTQQDIQIAKDVLYEWESVLQGAISFVLTNYKTDANLTIEYISFDQMMRDHGHYAGICYRTYYPTTGIIIAGEIYILHEAYGEKISNNRAVLRHEVGHCLGLGHSHVPSHVMYTGGGIPNPELPISATEKAILQLLYSIPANTRALKDNQTSSKNVKLMQQSRTPHLVQSKLDPTTGLITEAIP